MKTQPEMTIKFTLNGNPYEIWVDSVCFTAAKITTVNDDKSENYGKQYPLKLRYYQKLANAAQRCAREEIGTSDDVVTLKEFASRVEALNEQLSKQLDLKI
jgi:hypothetical protein